MASAEASEHSSRVGLERNLEMDQRPSLLQPTIVRQVGSTFHLLAIDLRRTAGSRAQAHRLYRELAQALDYASVAAMDVRSSLLQALTSADAEIQRLSALGFNEERLRRLTPRIEVASWIAYTKTFVSTCR